MAEPTPETVKILLVDDRPENLLVLRQTLARPDYDLVEATSGQAALKEVLRHDFAVILLDVLMPTMNGFETAWLIRQREASRYIPIIFLTATEVTNIYKAYSVGAVDYLVKPIDTDVVRAKVEVFVELFRKDRRIRQQEEQILKQSEQALRESESLYESTFREAPVGIGHCAADGRWIRVNQKLCDILGRLAEALAQRRLQDDLSTDDATDGLSTFHYLLRDADARTRRHEVVTVREDGQQSCVNLAISLLRDEAGRPKHFTVVVEDVTERWLAEQRQRFLAMASERLLSSFDHRQTLREVAELAVGSLAEACLLECGAEATYALAQANANPASLETLRTQLALEAPGSVAEALRAGSSVLVPEAAHALAGPEIGDSGLLGAVKALGGSSALVVPITLREQSIGTLVLVSRAGRYYGHADLRMAEDLAHRVAFAVENARLYRETETAVGVREEFLSIASHELRTPLTPLQLGLQMLLRKQGKDALERLPPERVRTLLARSENQVRRLSQLLDNLLDVSRISAGRLELQRERVDLVELVREVAGRLASDPTRSPTQIVADDPITGLWDRMRIEQVFMNLLSNALKYGGGKPATVTLERNGDAARIQVRDQGIGIAPERIERIFDRFERAVSPRAYGGLGLGLYIARQIVVAHHGTLGVTSQEGQGSVFTVELPLQLAAEAAGAEPQATPETGNGAARPWARTS